jgi:Raf kinase inhibitor-like YbhB/YbcL family protein
MNITSATFEDGMKIPVKHTCDGENVNPALRFTSVPDRAGSLVLIMDDPDALKPAGKVWDHWVVYDIPPTVTGIAEGREPEGTNGRGTSGNAEYVGPCPPDAEHRYFFRLYALDVMLGLPEGRTKGEVEQAMKGHIIAEATLTGTYDRKR